MYINFWYPMIRSEDLSPSKPEKVKVLGLNFAVFPQGRRGTGRRERHLHPSLTARRRVHGNFGQQPRRPGLRGLSVSRLGVRRRRQLRRHSLDRYGAASRARSTRIRPSKYGIVFAFLGDLPENERPPMSGAEWDQPGWRANSVITLDLNYYLSARSRTASTRRTTVRASDARLPKGAHREETYSVHGYG